MGFTVFNKYKDRWVLTSAQRVVGGGTIDALPVRLVDHDDREKLQAVLQKLLAEDHPVVPEPDWNDRRFTIGIRAEALGLKSWRAFAKDARCFNLEQHPDKLMLQEWPKRGGSFSGDALWTKEFSPSSLGQLVDYLIDLTKPTERRKKAAATRE